MNDGDAADFWVFTEAAEYQQYFSLLADVFAKLAGCYYCPVSDTAGDEAALNSLLLLFLNSVKALSLKARQLGAEGRRLRIDVSESGFPNFSEIEGLSVDLRQRAEQLRELPTEAQLKGELLDYIFKYGREAPELLSRLGARSYFDFIGSVPLFLSFTPGELQRQAAVEQGGRRSYRYSWACYDFQTNCPCLYLMHFDQSGGSSTLPLEAGGDNGDEFFRVLRQEGSRVPDIGILALALDDALDNIHPKLLRRVSVGPLYARFLMERADISFASRRGLQWQEILYSHWARSQSDFILHFREDLIWSERQELNRSLFAPLGKVREFFAIDSSDPECHERRASTVRHGVLLPHYLQQQLTAEQRAAIPDFFRAKIFTYDAAGDVHGV